LVEPDAFSTFRNEFQQAELRVLSDVNLRSFRILTRDDRSKLKDWKFERYFRSQGVRVLYALICLRQNLSDWSIPLNRLQQIACITVNVVGLGEAIDQLADRAKGSPETEDIEDLFGRAVLEEGILRGLV
jgi:hypothetical protein